MKNPAPLALTVPSWLLILCVLSLVVLFFGFTNITRVTTTSVPLGCGFLALLGLVVLLEVRRERLPV